MMVSPLRLKTSMASSNQTTPALWPDLSGSAKECKLANCSMRSQESAVCKIRVSTEYRCGRQISTC